MSPYSLAKIAPFVILHSVMLCCNNPDWNLSNVPESSSLRWGDLEFFCRVFTGPVLKLFPRGRSDGSFGEKKKGEETAIDAPIVTLINASTG